MQAKLRTPAGQKLYAQRKTIVGAGVRADQGRAVSGASPARALEDRGNGVWCCRTHTCLNGGAMAAHPA